tara:strand:- start:4384 stop:5394 length:1011 start_codon:yes stop_codon:yes gene_type:complete
MKFVLTIIFILFAPTPSYASDFPAKEVYKTISPSVVVIRASQAKGEGSLGAGSIISKEGHIVTNAHVVIDKATEKPYPRIVIYLKPANLTGITKNDLSRYLKAKVVRYSNKLDLALLKVNGLPSGIQIIELADPSEIKVGEEVVAIGHPEQGGFWSLTYGRISGKFKDYQGIPGKDMYQTDTSVNRGNSGGPLLDKRGYMAAVNSNIARLGKGGLPITGVNFAIKSSVVKKWLSEKGFMITYGTKPLLEEEKKAAKKPPTMLKDKDEREIPELQQKIPAPIKEEKRVETGTTSIEKKEDRILTPKRPYVYDDLVKAAEKDLEDMMKEMKGKIRKHQ